MIHRIRMARKRLMVARHKEGFALRAACQAKHVYLSLPPQTTEAKCWMALLAMIRTKRRHMRAMRALRAIERRKDRIA